MAALEYTRSSNCRAVSIKFSFNIDMVNSRCISTVLMQYPFLIYNILVTTYQFSFPEIFFFQITMLGHRGDIYKMILWRKKLYYIRNIQVLYNVEGTDVLILRTVLIMTETSTAWWIWFFVCLKLPKNFAMVFDREKNHSKQSKICGLIQWELKCEKDSLLNLL